MVAIIRLGRRLEGHIWIFIDLKGSHQLHDLRGGNRVNPHLLRQDLLLGQLVGLRHIDGDETILQGILSAVNTAIIPLGSR